MDPKRQEVIDRIKVLFRASAAMASHSAAAAEEIPEYESHNE
jgi:hypothetical protein